MEPLTMLHLHDADFVDIKNPHVPIHERPVHVSTNERGITNGIP